MVDNGATMIKRSLLVVVLALTVVLGGCGVGGNPEPAVHTAADGEVYNDADVAFATSMVPHLAETLQYVVIADERPLGREARKIADGIRETRVLEVEEMITWLTAWGEPVPETVLDHVNAGHGDHGDHAGSGAAEVEALRVVSDEEFEESWRAALRDQIAEGIPIAEDEQQHGLHADSVALAESLIATMEQQVAALG